MRIKSKLLYGKSIRDKSKVYDLLQSGKLPFGYYLLLCTKEGNLEFAPAWMQSNRYYLSDHFIVFGITYGKKEACNMIADIVSRVYTDQKYTSLKSYVKEVLGAEPC